MAVIVLGLIIIDQISKYYIQSTMSLGASIPVVADIFHITYILNPGAAFGILENQRWFFIIIAITMIGFTIYLYPKFKNEHWIMRIGTALLLGGAIGNLIDRIKTGYVVDFFDFRIWPIFNIADIGIVVGVSLIVYSLFFLVNKKDDCNGRE